MRWQTRRTQIASLLAVSCIAWLGRWRGKQSPMETNINFELFPLACPQLPLPQGSHDRSVKDARAGRPPDLDCADPAGTDIENNTVKSLSTTVIRALRCGEVRFRMFDDVSGPRARCIRTRDYNPPVRGDTANRVRRRSHSDQRGRQEQPQQEHTVEVVHRPNETQDQLRR